ncbi:uncharacterized protein LOC117168668 isoform X3 [Belonocnema kinseyi]|uniref:uncharacterized protein LOC117168668 isoform X3 n=1 Tax=Belonocnema kinseyi TaxID=2817044 RepID=UPI00143D864F|nr:uncharacterized protein LOC117168668 isoform X3 [Belonocnema kinseyi]
MCNPMKIKLPAFIKLRRRYNSRTTTLTGVFTKYMSPVRWARRKSSSSDSERNCYNVPTSQVTTERTSNKKDKKKIQEERRRICEKRNPLLDRVKTTRLSFLKDQNSDEGEDPDEATKPEFRSMCELSRRGLTRNDFRRSVCETELKELTEEEKTQVKRKKRSKSHSRLTAKNQSDERFVIFGFRTSTPYKEEAKPESVVESPKSRRGWRKTKPTEEEPAKKVDVLGEVESPIREGGPFDSVTPSSCLAAKFRAMQDRYLKSSTSKLIAKIYKKDSKDRERRRLRSFSYGTLPGLEELRTNPLYEDQDQDDNDSGILDNDSATSSLLDDRCSSGASELLTSMLNESSSSSSPPPPPRLPPRRPSAPINDLEKNLQLCQHASVLEASPVIVKTENLNALPAKPFAHNVCLGIERDPMKMLCQAANKELIQRQFEVKDLDIEKNLGTNLETNIEIGKSPKCLKKGLPVIRSSSRTTETMVVKLPRKTADQSLGIFIAKTAESSPGYLVAHVVPNGLADKEGTLKIGDEILIVNGKRLRGMTMAEARKILGNGSGPGVVDIVISRYSNVEQPRRLKESSVDYENVNIENGHGVIVENSPKSHFRKHNSRHHRDRKNESNRSISSEKSCTTIDSGAQSVSNFCTLPRRPRSTVSTFHTVVFEKGPGKKSLGFTIVGGRDSPKGSIGIFIKSVLPGGQAAEDGRLRAGDEILAVNGQVCHDLTHRAAVQLFRNTKSGPVALHLCRRSKQRDLQSSKAKSCADLLLVDT